MKKKIKKIIKKFTSHLNKYELAVDLLKLDKLDKTKRKPGLILIQIDGLSKTQLEKAFKNNEMPFLKKLYCQENYQLYSHYCGLPSATPSVQAELFYGVKQSVPAFSFYNKDYNSVMTMYNAKDALEIEKMISKDNPGLLKGGSSYSNVFSGSAKESHFCAVNLKWLNLLKDVRLLKRIVFILMYLIEIISIIFLMSWETLIAFFDFLKNLSFNKNILKELKFIPTRALFCILLRELITIGVRIDITRGFEIIHANFIGFDEQSHRRGPSSKFAHWTLKGIDGAIKRIYNHTLQNSKRHYDIWIYSDHGQENVVSYQIDKNQTLQKTVDDVLKDFKFSLYDRIKDDSIQYQRLRYFNSSFLNKMFLKPFPQPDISKNNRWIVTAIGPTANIYIPWEISFSFEQKCEFAKKLAKKLSIGFVAVNEKNNNKIRLFTKEESFLLPNDADKVFGKNHIFLKDLTKDFISLTQHKYAGEFTVCGSFLGRQPYSFPVENGAHAGVGQEQLNAFCLLPFDVFSLSDGQDYIYTRNLRQAVLDYRSLKPLVKNKFKVKHSKNKTSVRILTYNVHSCIGLDGHHSPERIARIIARHTPDIVTLQEIDMNKKRTDKVDQACIIADYLKMHSYFYPTISVEEEQYGNAILSRYPIELVRAGKFSLIKGKNHEIRGALWVKVYINSVPWQIINTHLGLNFQERKLQIDSLMGLQWLLNPKCVSPVILCGDFNAFNNSYVVKKIKQYLQNTVKSKKPISTWMSRYPIGQIDYIFVSKNMVINRVYSSDSDLDKVASDHLALVADVCLS